MQLLRYYKASVRCQQASTESAELAHFDSAKTPGRQDSKEGIVLGQQIISMEKKQNQLPISQQTINESQMYQSSKFEK